MSGTTQLGVTHCTSCGAEASPLRDECCEACFVRDAYADVAMIERERTIACDILADSRVHPADVVTIADLTQPTGQTSAEAHFRYFAAAGHLESAAATGIVSVTLPRAYIAELAFGATMAVDTVPGELEALVEPWGVGEPVAPLLDTLTTMVERLRFAQQIAGHLEGDPEDRCTVVLRRALLLWMLTEMVDTFRQCGTESERAALPFFDRLLDAARDETSPVIVGTEAT